MKSRVEVESLSKTYHLGRPLGRELLFGVKRPRLRALHQVSFSVAPGETLGIIGRNGSGKSTLLKLLARISTPSSGRAVLRGRVASLLEVGTGFHPDLTGRENIFLNGSLLGMKRTEIQRNISAIIDFSCVGKAIDTPVKHFSSGMYLRLAFAIAAHLEPDILLVDEVLSVGDYEFQQRCLESTANLTRAGKTVLFVSHNLAAVKTLCSRVLLLEAGEALALGTAQDVIATYMDQHAPRAEYVSPVCEKSSVRLERVRLLDWQGECRADLGYDKPWRIAVQYLVTEPIKGVSITLGVGTADRAPVFVTADFDMSPERLATRSPGRYESTVEVPARWLNAGRYLVIVYLGNRLTDELYEKQEVLSFTIDEAGTPGSRFSADFRKGVLQPYLPWTQVTA